MVDDVGVVLSLVPFNGQFSIFDNVCSLMCCVDGKPCRDFVNCLRFRDFNGAVALVWRCPRFKRVTSHG